jgi:hypothetical protein
VSSGFFDHVPVEILELILLQLDYATLGRLCGLNTKVEAFIKNRPWYKLVLEYCHGPLRAMVKTKLLHIHSAEALHKAFSNPHCSALRCSNLSDNLFLPTCRRYCFSCLGTTPTSTALCLRFVEEKYEVKWEEVRANMLCLKGPDVGYPTSIFALEDDMMDFTRRYYGKQRVIPHPDDARFWSRLATVAFPFVDAETQGVEFGRRCRACYEAYKEYAGIWNEIEIDPGPEKMKEWEREVEKMERTAEIVYNTKRFLWHYQSGECPKAKNFWSDRRIKG